jgi:hypothetical protein
MKLTGKRADKRDELLIGARAGLVDWNVYRKRVYTLERQEQKLIDAKKAREAERIKREEQKEKEKEARIAENRRKGAEKRKETLAKKKAEKQLGNQLVRRFVAGEGEETVREIWKFMRDSGVGEVRILVGTTDMNLTFMEYKTFRTYFKEGRVYDADWIFGSGDVILMVKPSNIDAKKLQQRFRDGVEHCVFVPIITKLTQKMENSSSKETKKRYQQRIAKLQEFREMYEEGVPESEMEEVAKASGMVISIHDVLGNVKKEYNEKGKIGTLKMTNTRENHLDEGSMVMSQDYEEVSESEMEQIYRKVKKSKEFYHIEGDIKNDMPSKIKLLNNSYKISNPEKDILNQFDKEIGVEKYRINASKYPELNKFLKAGCIVPGWATELNGGDATGHLDMPKAYAQFKKCSEYMGFLGVVHQWRSGEFDSKWVKEHLGFYKVKIESCSNDLFLSLGILPGYEFVMFSPEVLFFMKHGVKMTVSAGAWGSRFDFEFPDYMLENRRYCVWSGRTGCERTEKTYTFPGSREFAGHLKSELNDDKVLFWGDKGLITIKTPVKNVFTSHHILGGITSYLRIQMMEAMLQFDYSQLVKVVMDGIYFRGSAPACVDWFVSKEMKSHQCLEGWYENVNVSCNWGSVVYDGNTCVAGQGGAGKTYGILTDGCYNNVLYVAPQHILGQKVRKVYGANYTTYHQLIGVDCVPYITKQSYPPVIVLDELTQIDGAWIEKALKMYKDSMFLIVGDIDSDGMWYQTRNGKPGEFSKIWKPTGVNYVMVEGDRRSRDDKLKKLKLVLRDVMKHVFVDGDSGEEFCVLEWAKKNLNIIGFDKAVGMFSSGDTWIAGTHKTNQKLLDNNVVSGWYKKGGWISFEEKEGYEKRGSFTIHSYQGSTIDSGKVFISVDDLFEFSMLYTAISRAVNFSQLVFVGK